MSDTILTKICSKCNELTPLTWYYKDKRTFDGLYSACKTCVHNHGYKFKKTKDGLVSKILGQQHTSSRYRGHAKPDYNIAELREWMYSQPHFDELYDNWVASGYKKDLIPSCDRLDDYKPYTLDNLQLITWKENNAKSHIDMRNGLNNKQSKAVNQLDMDGSFIKRHYSQSSAFRLTGIRGGNICSCCRGDRSHAGGFKWAYADS